MFACRNHNSNRHQILQVHIVHFWSCLPCWMGSFLTQVLLMVVFEWMWNQNHLDSYLFLHAPWRALTWYIPMYPQVLTTLVKHISHLVSIFHPVFLRCIYIYMYTRCSTNTYFTLATGLDSNKVFVQGSLTETRFFMIHVESLWRVALGHFARGQPLTDGKLRCQIYKRPMWIGKLAVPGPRSLQKIMTNQGNF